MVNEPSASINPDNHALDIKGLSFKGFLTKSVFLELFNQSISLYKLWILVGNKAPYQVKAAP